MSDCIFCRIIAKELPAHVIFEDDEVLVFLDINPINPGHVLVVPKKHSISVLKMNNSDLALLMHRVQEIAPKIIKAVKSDSCNITMNCGRAAGQVVFHTHVHIIPRFPTDGYTHWKREGDEMDDLGKIAKTIKQELK